MKLIQSFDLSAGQLLPMELSGVEETDHLIFLELTYPEMVRFAQSSREMYRKHQLNSNALFWLRRLQKDYPCAEEFKPNEISHREFYEQFIRSKSIPRAAELGYLGVIKWTHHENFFTSREAKCSTANKAAAAGHLPILEWLSTLGILPDKAGARGAIENGQLEVLKWLYTKGVVAEMSDMVYAARNGHLKVLEWMYFPGSRLWDYGARLAAEKGHLEVLKWYRSKGILPDQRGVNSAAEHGFMEILEWLESHGILPDQDGIKHIAEAGQLKVLIWLAQRKIYPTKDAAYYAAVFGGHLDVLIWLSQFGIPIAPYSYEKDEEVSLQILKWTIQNDPKMNLYSYHADHAARQGHPKVLEWFESKGVLPTSEGADYAAKFGHLKVLEWMGKRGILPKKIESNDIVWIGHLGVLKWLYQQNKIRLPDQSGANRAAGSGRVDVLEWLSKFGILPTQEGIEHVGYGKQFEVLKWASQFGILPNHKGINNAVIDGRLEVLKWARQKGIPVDLQAAFDGGWFEILKWDKIENHQA